MNFPRVEPAECIMHCRETNDFFTSHATGANWTLHSIFCDPVSEGESSLSVPNVLLITPSSDTRGIWPSELQIDRDSSDLEAIQDCLGRLYLQGVHHSSGSLVLDFKSLWLRVEFMPHSRVRFYNQQEWKTLCQNPRDPERKIVMALEFQDFVLVFLSPVNIVQATWAKNRDELHLPKFQAALENAWNWIQEEILVPVPSSNVGVYQRTHPGALNPVTMSTTMYPSHVRAEWLEQQGAQLEQEFRQGGE